MKCSQCKTRLVNKGKICSTCKSRNYREKNPLKAAYHNLKGHAKARGKEFTLTFEEFKEFAVEVDYIPNKGSKSHSYHIDRIDETKGYSRNNIQILTNAENTKKYKAWREAQENQSSFVVITVKEDLSKHEDCPF